MPGSGITFDPHAPNKAPAVAPAPCCGYSAVVMGQRATSVVRVVASLALAAALFAYFLHRAPVSEVWAALTHVQLGYLSAAVAAALLAYALRAIRWGLILRPAGQTRTLPLLGATAAGFAVSTVLPARAGEVVRPLVLAARCRLPAAATLASIATERLLDLASVLALFVVGVTVGRQHLQAASLPALSRSAAVAAAALAVGIGLVAALVRDPSTVSAAISRRLPRRFRARGTRLLEHLLAGIVAVRQPRSLTALTLASLSVWLPVCWQIQWTARAFRFDIPLAAAFVVLGVSILGLAVPTPGGVGAFHATVQFALTAILGLDLKTATAYALVHHAVCFFPITALGLAYLAATGMGLRRAAATADDREAGGA